uniref:SGNH hydrolase domain-containing protein n=2 Tax=Nitrosomonas TaxID=914 RepID=UPI0026100603
LPPGAPPRGAGGGGPPPPTARKNPAVCLMLLAIGYTGFNTYERDGLGFRVEKFTRNYAVLFDERSRPWAAENQEAVCKARFPFAAENAYCRLDKDAAPSVLIIGDSHSNSLYPGMVNLFAESTEVLAGLGSGGCVPFREMLSFDRKTSEEDRGRCLSIISQALDAAGNSAVHTVLLVSRGPLYLTGKGFAPDDFADEKNHDWVLHYQAHPELADYMSVWETAMRAMLAELVSAGKRVIFVLDNPELGFDPKSCIDSRPFRLTPKNLRSPCAVPRAVFEERNRDYRTLVARVLADFPQVVLIDGAKPFCDEQWCWAMKDGKILYFDDDHVSLGGARLIAQEILPYLNIPHQ